MDGLMSRIRLVEGIEFNDTVREKPVSANYLKITPRTGLLKNHFAQGKLETFFENYKDMFEFDEFEKDIRVFIENEEFLITQGHMGEYALFYGGELWGILPVYRTLIDSFYKKEGNHSCYCDKIGSGFDPNEDI